jgi:hypothetical protein
MEAHDLKDFLDSLFCANIGLSYRLYICTLLYSYELRNHNPTSQTRQPAQGKQLFLILLDSKKSIYLTPISKIIHQVALITYENNMCGI